MLPKWFEKERDGDERYLELASTAKIWTERVLRLDRQLSTVSAALPFRCINSDSPVHSLGLSPANSRHLFCCESKLGFKIEMNVGAKQFNL